MFLIFVEARKGNHGLDVLVGGLLPIALSATSAISMTDCLIGSTCYRTLFAEQSALGLKIFLFALSE